MANSEKFSLENAGSTPRGVIALVSRTVTRVVDRITGDRFQYPLLTATATKAALRNLGIDSRVFYGPCAWVEVSADNKVHWNGFYGKGFGFWLQTEFAETVDLNVNVATRSGSGFTPPLIWSKEIPVFYRYSPEGVAEIDLTDSQDLKWLQTIEKELLEKCKTELIKVDDDDFGDNSILCPGRKVLDNPAKHFQYFDRALSVLGVPKAPF